MNESSPPQRIEILLKVYGNQTASADEIRELFQLLEKSDGDDALRTAVLESFTVKPEEKTESGRLQTDGSQPATTADPVWAGISQTIRPRRRLLTRRLVFSAAALFIMVFGLVTWFAPGKTRSRGGLQADMALRSPGLKPDVAPGTTKAVLILANGEKIWLDSARNGSLAEQGNARIVKLAHGQLAYTTSGTSTGSSLYNSVETPRGGEYQVRLPDGTRVWLNASSSLRFPTCFTGPDRRVELTGEAYFEVAKEVNRPFHVKIGQTDIRVLGTHFNVMGYANEKELRTTLLEGKVNVTTSGETKKLVPGNEAVVAANAKSIAVGTGNPEQAVAWKNGFFRFHETGIRAIMRQVERWYDVDVAFQTEAKDQDFTGVIPRSENLSALLQTLELTGTVHFQIVGKKVVVLP